MNPKRGYEKGTVEQTVRFMRRNLLVPLPQFDYFDSSLHETGAPLRVQKFLEI